MTLDHAFRIYAHQLSRAITRRHLAFRVVDFANDNGPPEAA